MNSVTKDQHDAEMLAWAKAGNFRPRIRLTAAEAADSNRVLLESAGVDVGALEKRVGRPRIDPSDETVSITFRAPKTIERAAKILAEKQGRDRSDILRDALSEYVMTHQREFVDA